MPKMSLADTLLEWDSLLSALNQPEMLAQPHLNRLRDELAALVQSLRAQVAEHASLEARRQALSQQLRITRSKGQDLVIKVRSAVKAQLGHRNEGLVQYRIRPVRRLSRAAREEIGIAATPAAPPAKNS